MKNITQHIKNKSTLKRCGVVFALFSMVYTLPSTVNALTVPKMPSNEGLVGYWSFDEGLTNKSRDLSGKGNHGTLTNMANPATATSGWTNSGKVNGGVVMDGSDDSVLVTGTNGIGSITNAISISLWVKPGATQVDYADIISNHDSTAGFAIEQYGSATNQYYFAWSSAAGPTCHTSAIYTFTLTPNVWQHVGISKSGATVTYYINGTQVGTCTGVSSTITPSSYSLYMGRWAANTSRPWKGAMDDVRIYNRALSASEIRALANNLPAKISTSYVAEASTTATTGINGGLVGYWTFDGKNMTAATSTDSSPSGNHATRTSSPAVALGKVGQAISFASGAHLLVPDSNSLDLTTKLTISSWINSTDNASSYRPHFICKGTTGSSGSYCFIIEENTGFLRLYLDVGSNWQAAVTGTVNMKSSTYLSKWTHVAATWDGTTVRLYINGVQDTSASFSGTLRNSTGYLGIGRDPWYSSSDYALKGKMDDVRIYNRALSASEIVQVYKLGGK